MGHIIKNKFIRRSLKILVTVVVIIALLPLLIYIPPVQDFAVRTALNMVNKSGDMHIEVGRLRLRWPLRLSVTDVTVMERTDTMVTLGDATIGVQLLPLLKLDIQAEADINRVNYRMGGPDSAMWLTAAINKVRLEPSSYNLHTSAIDISRATVDGADVMLLMHGNDTTAAPVDTAAPSPLSIHAGILELRNVNYRMSMMPTIDSLGVNVPIAVLREGSFDMASRSINARYLCIDSIAAAYITPSAAYLAEHPVDSVTVAADTTAMSPDDMWTIRGDSLRLTASNALYAMRDAVPQPGLDMNYLQVSGVAIAVDSFYNRGTDITVPLTRLIATERSGLKLNGSGRFIMADSTMRAEHFDLTTLFSNIKFSGLMGMGDLTSDPKVPLKLDLLARIGIPDLELIMPSMRPMLATIPRYNDMKIVADINGTAGDLHIDELSAALPGYVNISAQGNVANMTNPDNLEGTVNLDGRLTNVNFIKPSVLEARLAKQVNIPPTRLEGRVNMHRGAIAGNLQAITGGGDILLNAGWNGRIESYNLNMAMRRFPVNSFMPEAGVGIITAHANVKGHGYDPFSRRTSLAADISLDSIQYQNLTYTDISAWARLDTGSIDAGIMSANPNAHLDLTIGGTLAKDDYDIVFDGRVHNLDLRAMRVSPTLSRGSLNFGGRGHVMPERGFYDASLSVTDLNWEMTDLTLATPAIGLNLLATDSLLKASLDNESLHADLISPSPLDTILARVNATMELINHDIAAKHIDIDSLQATMPEFMLKLSSGANSIVSDFLDPSRTSIRKYELQLSNDSLINMQGYLLGIKSGETKVDTITLSAMQHKQFLVYKLDMNNRPGTFDAFAHVNATGFIANNNISLFLNQENIQKETGFKIGFNVAVLDSLITLRLVPLKPVIGYKDWSLNPDNLISYNLNTRHLDADLKLSSNESHFTIYTDSTYNGHEKIVVKADGIQLDDWLSVSPFAPPMNGVASADISVAWDPENSWIGGKGYVNLENLTYGRDRVGSFLLDLALSTNSKGVTHATTTLSVDSVKVITATGALNDSTASNPFMLDFSMIKLPLNIVNPFIPEGTAKLQGTLNGTMDVTGTLTEPVFNGYLDFDSAAVMIDMIGTAIHFSEEKIPVDSNIVHFDNYTLTAKNENPLYINGTVNMHTLASPVIDLTAKARNMQIIGSDKSKHSQVYGRGFIDLDATVKGNMNYMGVNAKLNLLEGSNITYAMMATETGMTGLSSANEDMVRFVQFSDSASIYEQDTISTSTMAMNLNATLIISQGTTINVDISSNGQDKAQIEGNGTLNFTMSPFSDMRMTGRFNIDKGFVRYTPPLMSQKLFNFINDSYVSFNGDMMNPILNLHARETLKANVTEEGQNSRLVNFLITLNVTGTLNTMDVSFDLATNDDISVQNELDTMSPEQRANQAMNLLLYNVYTGPGTKASSNLSGNPLFSFLTSQLNTWAANTIKGVDISFGIDQYDRTYDGNTSTTTSYSYKVSKTLFNDRVKIIVGGNYSTDANADENFSENLINDISFEYLLNKAGTMYVRLFRHVGYESILEGEVTQTGVGFVYKRKMTHFRDLFHRRRNPEAVKPQDNQPENSVTDEDNRK